MILVTGAAGKTGQAVIQALVQRGETVRALVYREAHVATVQSLGLTDVVYGDMQQAEVWRQAMNEVRALYFICPNMHPREFELARLATGTARDAGVRRFVYHSVLHPQTETMPHHWQKLRVEELLFETGLNFTILQPAAYMQNILGSWPSITGEGVYRVPYPVETRLSLVDLADVAEVAARALAEPGHDYAIYELVGPASPSQVKVAALLSEVLGRTITPEQISPAAWRRGAEQAGLGDYQIETLLKMFRYYEQYHFLGNANVLRWLLGREPTDLKRFFQRMKDKQ